MVEPGEMRGDRREEEEEEEEARGEEETPMTSKLRLLDRTGPVWRHWLSEKCCARSRVNGKTVTGFRGRSQNIYKR